MRKQDAFEVYCSHGVSPIEALRISFMNSHDCFTIIMNDEKIVGMFGVVQMDDAGMPWMLSSDDLAEKQNAATFLPKGRAWVDSLKSQYKSLYNYVHADNTVSIRWLKWLGFDLNEEFVDWGKTPSRFIRFGWNN
tara:strand:- start:155 stop:559 length:405 start_codon:yes stop_codon:yes gene_type:complete